MVQHFVIGGEDKKYIKSVFLENIKYKQTDITINSTG